MYFRCFPCLDINVIFLLFYVLDKKQSWKVIGLQKAKNGVQSKWIIPPNVTPKPMSKIVIVGMNRIMELFLYALFQHIDIAS